MQDKVVALLRSAVKGMLILGVLSTKWGHSGTRASKQPGDMRVRDQPKWPGKV